MAYSIEIEKMMDYKLLGVYDLKDLTGTIIYYAKRMLEKSDIRMNPACITVDGTIETIETKMGENWGKNGKKKYIGERSI